MSADSAGCVVVWSMTNYTPTIYSSFSAHNLSLSSLHVVDANRFLSISTDKSCIPSTSDSGTIVSPPVQVAITEPFIVITFFSKHLVSDMANLSLHSTENISAHTSSTHSAVFSPPSTSSFSFQFHPSFSTQIVMKLWEFDKPPKLAKVIGNIGPMICSSIHHHTHPSNTFLGVGMKGGVVKVYNIPTFTLTSSLFFQEVSSKDCIHIQLSLSRETPPMTPAYYKNPFGDLILTSVWSDGEIMVCQVAKE